MFMIFVIFLESSVYTFFEFNYRKYSSINSLFSQYLQDLLVWNLRSFLGSSLWNGRLV